jgi:hypothetical protein
LVPVTVPAKAVVAASAKALARAARFMWTPGGWERGQEKGKPPLSEVGKKQIKAFPGENLRETCFLSYVSARPPGS